MGYYWNVWLSDDAIDEINYGSILLFCARWFGTYAVIAAIIITIHLIAITNANEGDGVYFKILLYVVPAPWITMVDLASQCNKQYYKNTIFIHSSILGTF